MQTLMVPMLFHVISKMFYGISVGFLWDFHDISMIFVWDSYDISMRFLWDSKMMSMVLL